MMYQFQQAPRQEPPIVHMIRVIPTVVDCPLAFCSPDLVQYHQVWTQEREDEWQQRRGQWQAN